MTDLSDKQKDIILLIEDDKVDVLAIKYGLKKQGIEATMVVAVDGVDAIDKIREIKHKASDQPKIIFLDINLPRMNAFDFMKELFINLKMKEIPVIIVTTSDEPSDLKAAKEFKVAGYFLKPIDFNKLAPLYRKLIAAL